MVGKTAGSARSARSPSAAHGRPRSCYTGLERKQLVQRVRHSSIRARRSSSSATPSQEMSPTPRSAAPTAPRSTRPPRSGSNSWPVNATTRPNCLRTITPEHSPCGRRLERTWPRWCPGRWPRSPRRVAKRPPRSRIEPPRTTTRRHSPSRLPTTGRRGRPFSSPRQRRFAMRAVRIWRSLNGRWKRRSSWSGGRPRRGWNRCSRIGTSGMRPPGRSRISIWAGALSTRREWHPARSCASSRQDGHFV